MKRRVEHSVLVQRPAEAVFAFLVDCRRHPEWESGVVALEQSSPGPVGVGTRLTEVRRFLGRTVRTMYEVSAFDAGRCIAMRSLSGPVQVTGEYLCEQTDAGTRVTDRAEFETSGFFTLVGPMFARTAKRTMVKNFATLKRTLEAQPPG